MGIFSVLMREVTLTLKTPNTFSPQKPHPNGMKLGNSWKPNEKNVNKIVHKDLNNNDDKD